MEIEYVQEGFPKDWESVGISLLKTWGAEQIRTRRPEREEVIENIIQSPKLVLYRPIDKSMVIARIDRRRPPYYDYGAGYDYPQPQRTSLIRSTKPLPSNVFFYGSAFRPNLLELYNRVVGLGVLPSLLDSLKKQIGYMQDLRTIGDGLYVFEEGLERPLPISFIGDGFRATLLTSFVSVLAESGTLILEEPEISLHPGFIEDLLQNDSPNLWKKTTLNCLQRHTVWNSYELC